MLSDYATCAVRKPKNLDVSQYNGISNFVFVLEKGYIYGCFKNGNRNLCRFPNNTRMNVRVPEAAGGKLSGSRVAWESAEFKIERRKAFEYCLLDLKCDNIDVTKR